MASTMLAVVTSLRGQPMPASFGEMIPIDVPEVVDRGTVIHSWSPESTAVLLWNVRSDRLLLGVTDSLRAVWTFRALKGAPAFSSIHVADLDLDGSPDLLFADRQSRSIKISSHWRWVDSMTVSPPIASPVTPSRVLVRDVNGDRFPDLLVFDENEPGIHLLLNRGGRRWQTGRTIAPELPVRSAVLTYLNNDEIPDLIAFDWVRSEFHTLYGVGSGRFLDQGLYRSPSGADQIVLAPPREDEPVRFMAVQRAPGEVAYWTMDDRGDLALRHRVLTDGVIHSSFLATTDGRSETDLATLTPPGRLRIHHFASGLEGVESVESGVPERSSWAFPVPISGTEEVDVLVLIPEQLSALLLRSGRRHLAWRDSVWLSVGLRPEGVVAADLDGNGGMDLVVANRLSSRLSIIWSGDSLWQPSQIQVDTPRDVTAVTARTSERGVVRIVTTHPSTPSIAVIDLALADNSVETTELPVPGIPERAKEEVLVGSSRSLTSINQSKPNSMSISVFEPIRNETYLERGLSLSAPATLLGAAFEDMDNDSVGDLIMVFKPDDTTRVSIGIAFGDSVFSMLRRTTSTEFPDSTVQRAYVWTADVNADSLQDIVIVFPRSSQTIYVVINQRDTVFAPPVAVDSAVRVESRSRFRVADLDGDGFPDLVAHVVRRGGVGWWKNDGTGSWSEWQTLVRARDVGGIEIADINGDGRPDLVLTRPDWGAVTIYDGPSVVLRARSEVQP